MKKELSEHLKKAKFIPIHMIKDVVCGYLIEYIEDEFEVYKQYREVISFR